MITHVLTGYTGACVVVSAKGHALTSYMSCLCFLVLQESLPSDLSRRP